MSPQKISQHLWPHNMLGMLDPSSVTSCLGAKKIIGKFPWAITVNGLPPELLDPFPFPGQPGPSSVSSGPPETGDTGLGRMNISGLLMFNVWIKCLKSDGQLDVWSQWIFETKIYHWSHQHPSTNVKQCLGLNHSHAIPTQRPGERDEMHLPSRADWGGCQELGLEVQL